MKGKTMNLKSNEAITLIALVITIIILIILAGVSISIVFDEDGLINKAKSATEQYKMSQIKEKIELAITDIQTEEISNKRNMTLDTLITSLPTKLTEIILSKEENKITGQYEGYDFVIDENFKVTIEGYNPQIPETPEVPEIYSVTFKGTNVTSNGESVINENETYKATLVAAESNQGIKVTIKIGEKLLLENTDYMYENGELTIPNVTGNIEIEAKAYYTVASKKTTEKVYFEDEIMLIDSDSNLVKVPKGFKIAEDSGINVTEGIVIEDNDVIQGVGNNRGNQYVWIPVGENIKKSDGTIVNITLGRYVFADGTNHKDNKGNVLQIGTPILIQNADNYEDETEIHAKEVFPTSTYTHTFQELKTNREGVSNSGLDGLNATASDLKGFIDSVNDNGGYYIARYEASYGTDEKANSKVSNLYANSGGLKYAPTSEGTLWNNISQINAKKVCKNLYQTAKTDLINSYAWDTAIVYIQEFSEDTDYSYQKGTTVNPSLTNTGVNKDEKCKINDMGSNAREWTTEYCNSKTTSNAYACIDRGGDFSYEDHNTSFRGGNLTTHLNEHYAFRAILYN